MYGLRLLIDVDAHQPQHEVLQCHAKVLQVVGVEHGIDSRIEVGEYDAEQRQLGMHIAVRTEGLDAVDRVQRYPADHKEEHNDRQILRGLHVPFTCCAQHAEHGACMAAAPLRGHLHLGGGGASA